MAEGIDREKCNFRNFTSSVTLTLTLTLEQVEVIRMCIFGRDLPTHQIRSKLEIGRMDVGTAHLSSNLLGHRLAIT